MRFVRDLVKRTLMTSRSEMNGGGEASTIDSILSPWVDSYLELRVEHRPGLRAGATMGSHEEAMILEVKLLRSVFERRSLQVAWRFYWRDDHCSWEIGASFSGLDPQVGGGKREGVDFDWPPEWGLYLEVTKLPSFEQRTVESFLLRRTKYNEASWHKSKGAFDA